MKVAADVAAALGGGNRAADATGTPEAETIFRRYVERLSRYEQER
jgi:hypothetical protein